MASRFALAKDRLLIDIVGVIADVFGATHANPKRRNRRRWSLTNPWTGSEKLSVYLAGHRAGGWIDFSTGETGDIIDLVALGLDGRVDQASRMTAVQWAEDRFGLRSMDQGERDRLAAQAASRRAAEAAKAKVQEQDQRERVRKMFFASDARILDTPVETYLGTRGVPLGEVPNITPAFRYRAACEYWPLASLDGEGRRIAPGPGFDAMVSAMVGGDGKLAALHLTFLAAGGRGKAPVQELALSRGLNPKDFSAKLYKGDVLGLVVRCTNGPSGLSMEQAAARGIADWAGVTEGIEDAFTAAICDPQLRMCAAGSLSGLLAFPDHDAIKGYLVFRDNDWGKPQAQAQFRAAMARFRSFGKPVDEVAMPADWGKDVNEALNQEH